jgi:hypothetical protein
MGPRAGGGQNPRLQKPRVGAESAPRFYRPLSGGGRGNFKYFWVDLVDEAHRLARSAAPVQGVVVCGNRDETKRNSLLLAGLCIASEWFVKEPLWRPRNN